MSEQPKDFGYSEEAKMLKDSAKKLFRDALPEDKLHRMVAGNPSAEAEPQVIFDADLWKQMVELGWTAIAVPERAGGLGMGMVELTALVEEVGRACVPSPLIATINATLVLAACETPEADAVLGRIAAGESATLAITNAAGSWASSDTDVSASGDALNGTAWFVQDAGKAGILVVKAKTANGIALYVVDAKAAGVAIEQDAIVDLTRDQAHVTFNNAQATLVSKQGAAALDKAEPAVLTVVSADMVGAAEWQLQTTVAYANTREQFDHALGFFQAVKHPLVNVMIDIDQARSLTYNAACALDTTPAEALKWARMAKSAASDTAEFASSRSVQFHGGIGFTWECYVHLWFKRQMHNAMLYGDGRYQRAQLASMLM